MNQPAVISTEWNGSRVEILARAVPRYLWQTTSIDVAVDGAPVLKTGGALKITGEHPVRFSHRGLERSVSLSWGRASFRSFPIKLQFDDSVVYDGHVRIQNWWATYWPWAAVLALIVWRFVR
jgi:hypothetical protein